MNKDFFDTYIGYIAHKYILHASSEPEWNDWKKYTQGLRNEIDEVEIEIKDNNAVYLEDELGDILRCFLNTCYILEQEKKIDSIESVFIRSLKKYSTRIDTIKAGGIIEKKINDWEIVKKQQKEENKLEHNQRYGEIQ